MEKDKGDEKKDVQRRYVCYNFEGHEKGDHGKKNIVTSSSDTCTKCGEKSTPFVVPQF